MCMGRSSWRQLLISLLSALLVLAHALGDRA